MSRNRRRKPSLSSVVFTMILFDISAFGVLILNSETFDPLALIAMAATVLLLIFQYFILSVFFPNCDRTVLVIANFLVSVGLVIQFRISPSVAMKQLVWIVMGMVCMIVTPLAIRRSKIWPNLWRILIGLSGVFCVVAAVSAAYMPVAGINIEAAVVLTARKTAVILLKNLFIYYLHQI